MNNQLKILCLAAFALVAPVLADSAPSDSEKLPPIAQDHLWPLWEQQVKTSWESPEGGYSNRFGVTTGGQIDFHISTTRRRQTLFVFREGDRRQLVKQIEDVHLTMQPVNPDEPYANGFDWKKSLSLKIPGDWESGIYVLQFMTGFGVKEIPFAVRQKNSGAKILWVISDATFQAYNPAGGKSSYNYQSTDRVRSSRLSLDRPFGVDGTGSFLLRSQHFLAWLDREGIEVDFCSQRNLVENPKLLNSYECMLRVGHDEYWSMEELVAVTDFWQSGGNVAFFSGNNIYWRIRYEDDGRTMVNYKDEASWPAGLSEQDARDPLAWQNPELDTALFVNLPPAQAEMVLQIRGVSGTGMVNFKWKESNEEWWPNRFKVGEMALGSSSGFGGFAVQRPDHWIFAGTGIEQGDQLGQAETICGTEVDYLDMEWVDGRPYPTGKDGISKDWEILATTDVARYREREVDTGAMVFRPAADGRGAVFNASTLQWGHGLETNEAVQQMTRNVLRAFVK